jgi:hypothetical protein
MNGIPHVTYHIYHFFGIFGQAQMGPKWDPKNARVRSSEDVWTFLIFEVQRLGGAMQQCSTANDAFQKPNRKECKIMPKQYNSSWELISFFMNVFQSNQKLYTQLLSILFVP